jgi:hypothetical protein
MQPKNLKDEEYREYDFAGRKTTYRIHDPASLFVGKTTHRIVDVEGIVHCVPAPGFRGCVLRWKPRDGANPVAF